VGQAQAAEVLLRPLSAGSGVFVDVDGPTDVVQVRGERDDHIFRPRVEKIGMTIGDFRRNLCCEVTDLTGMIDVMLCLMAAQLVPGFVESFDFGVGIASSNKR